MQNIKKVLESPRPSVFRQVSDRSARFCIPRGNAYEVIHLNIKISADSTCDLSPELVEAYGIGITPLYIVMGEQTLRDGLDVKPADLYQRFRSTGKLCQTAAVNVADYIAFFKNQLETHDAVIHFTISSDMSGCYQNACIAAQDFDGRVFPVDARNLSTGIGHLVLDAADMAKEGRLTPAEIADVLNEKKAKLDVSFVLDTLEYLKAGGRCSSVAAFGANLLSLKPSIEVKNGAMGVGKKYRGKIVAAYKQYITDRLKGHDDIDTKRIFITDSGIDESIRQELHELVASLQPFEEILHTQAGCTISQHCGPGCMGILYYHK